MQFYRYYERERERERGVVDRDRQTDGQIDRQKDRQTDTGEREMTVRCCVPA